MKYHIIVLVLTAFLFSCANNKGVDESKQSNTSIFNPSSTFAPFKMGIVKPNTAIVDKSLNHFKDSIELGFVRDYYNSIQQMEERIAFNASAEGERMNELYGDSDSLYKAQLKYLKENKEDILDSKYYEVLSSYATKVYSLYFYASIPVTTVQEIRNVKDASPIHLMDSLNLDYLLTYENIHTVSVWGDLEMRVTSKLFSLKEGKDIFITNSVVDNLSHGEMWTCDNELLCFMLNSIRKTVDEYSMEIRRRQLQ
jgi:hypothetical protein